MSSLSGDVNLDIRDETGNRVPASGRKTRAGGNRVPASGPKGLGAGGKRISQSSLRRVFLKAGRLFQFPYGTEVQLSFVTDRRMRGLNRRTRGKDRSTDVLSFPLHDAAELRSVALLRRSLEAERVRGRVRTGFPRVAERHEWVGPGSPVKSRHPRDEWVGSVRPVGQFARADWPRDPDGVFRLGDVVVAVGTAWRQAREVGVPLNHELTRLFAHGLLHLLGFDHQKQSQARAMERITQDIVGSVGKKAPVETTRKQRTRL